MNDFVIRGNSEWTQNSIEATTDPRNGDTTTITATATTQAQAVAQTLYYRNLGWSVAVKQAGKGDLWNITATYNADLITDPLEQRVPDFQWEIQPHSLDVPIFDCTDRPFISGLSTVTKGLIEEANKNSRDGYPQLTEATADQVAQLPNAIAVLSLMKDGCDTKQLFTTSVKRSITVSTRFNASWELIYNDMVLTKSFLANHYAVPLWVQRLMPESDTEIQTDINGKTTFYGYLENQPAYQSVSRNRVNISQEWVYHKWSAGDKGLYDVQF
jgi:hypothetical protein